MSQYTPQQLREKYKELPEDVQEAIFSVDSAKIIQNIGRKYSLNIDNLGELADEVGLLMLGLTEPKDFIPNIARRLEVDKKTAHDITAEVNEKIFSKIRESLKEIHHIADEEEDSNEKEIETTKTEVAKPTEMPPAPKPSGSLNKEDILKEIEETEVNSVPSVLQGSNKSTIVESSFPPPPSPTPPATTIPIQISQKETIEAEEEKEISIPPPPPAVVKEGSETLSGVGGARPQDTREGGESVSPPVPQISRRPLEVSEHNGDKPLGPGGDRYPEGDPYREPIS